MKKKQYLYMNIYEDIKDKIMRGELREGECLPKNEKIAESYGVSTITITHALNRLRDEGCVKRIKGKGTYVCGAEKSKTTKEKENELMRTEDSDSGGQKKIGLVLEHVSSCFGLDMLYAADQYAENAGYKLCVRFSYGSREKETEEIRFLRNIGVEGIIIMPCHGTYYNTELVKLIIDGFPAVLIDKRMKGIPVSSVRTDNRQAMEMMIEYMVRRGKKKIGLITAGEDRTSSVKERRKGFHEAIEKFGLEACEECKLPYDGAICIYSEVHHDAQWEAMIEDYIDSDDQLDGIVCSEYAMAIYVGKYREKLKEKGIAVCSIDEDYLSSSDHFFTHVRQDEKAIASQAVMLMVQQIEDKEHYRRKDYLIPGLFVEGKE